MSTTYRKSLISSTALVLLLTANHAYAQTQAGQVEAAMPQTAGTQDAASSGEDPAIVVTGYRAGLQRAQAVKQNNYSVVEALSSEDIGKLPQASVADSLGRLSGLAGERRAGRVSGISVRGFREDYVGSMLNGRELIGIGDNRGVEYDLYPTEIMAGATVYKTPNAGLAATGIGGTVDLQTIRPLEHAKVLTLNASYEQNGQKSDNPDFSNHGYRFAGSFSDKFADDTLGVAFTAAVTSSPTQDEYTSVWGYSKGQVTSGPNVGKYAPTGVTISSNSNVLKRTTFAGVVQWKPSDVFNVTLDGLHINYSETGISRGFFDSLSLQPDGSGVISATDTAITSGRSTGFNSVMFQDPRRKTGKLNVFGGNFKFDPSSDFHVSFDASHSDSNKSDARDETYAGLGRAGLTSQGPNTLRTYQVAGNGIQFSSNSQAFDNFSAVKLAGPQSWGGTMAPLGAPGGPLYQTAVRNASGTPIGYAQAQDGFINDALFDEFLNAARLDVRKDFADGLVKNIQAGLRYSSHKKSKVNQGYFLVASTYPNDGTVPAGSQAGLASLEWTGLGKIVAYDARGLIDNGFYKRYDDTQLEPDRAGDTYAIRETIWQPYVQSDFEHSFAGGARIFGNAGVQGVFTKQRGSGNNSYTGANLYDIAIPVSDGASYARVLPSLNFNLDLTHGHVIRLALAKTISRPRIDSLNPGSSVAFKNSVATVTSTDPVQGPWVSSGGNAQLRPYEANQADLSYEYYFARDGFISVSAFYKHLVNWNKLSTTIRNYSQFYIPGYHQAVSNNGSTVYTPATFLGVNTGYVGGLKGEVKGVEAQATIPLGHLVHFLDGFGVVAGAAYTDGSLDDGSRVPGLSENVYQATLFYEKDGFAVRVSGNRRSNWLSEDRGGSNTLVAVQRAGETLVDAQISYDFKNAGIRALSGLRLSLQAQNLTNQQDTYTDSVSGLILRNERFGRNFLLNATFSLF